MTASSTYGRAIDIPMVNKSGVQVVLGDAVIYDTSNNDGFTTSTSTGSTLACGIAQETIPANATGRIRTAGYTSLATPTASVTRGHYGYIGGVAKQVTDAGASRIAGTFLYFMTGGTTPDAIIYPVDLGAGTAAGRLIGVQRITATGAYTYTPTSGTVSVVVELQGAGGGGGAVAAGTAGQTRVAAGGAGGGWLRKRLTANFSGATGSVGAKGAGGSSGGDNAGGAGGDTTFIDTAGSPTTYTASGGEATRVGATNGSNFINGGENYGGTTTNGDDGRPGDNSRSGYGSSAATATAHGGDGGSSHYGAGGSGAITTTTAAGVAASGKGGGGGGGANVGTGASAAGGNGSDGVVIIWEYS